VGVDGWKRVWLGVLPAIILVSGCAVKRLDNGVYHSSKGYRVTTPSPQWLLVDDSPADLELRHRSVSAGMATHAVCEERTIRRSSHILARQLLVGIRDRSVIARGEVDVAGRPAVRAVVDARASAIVVRVSRGPKRSPRSSSSGAVTASRTTSVPAASSSPRRCPGTTTASSTSTSCASSSERLPEVG